MTKEKRKHRGKQYFQRGGADNKLPYPVFVGPQYQRGYGVPEFWRRSVVPFFKRMKRPLAKALIFGGKVLKDHSKGKSISESIGSHLPGLISQKTSIKPEKNVKKRKQKRAAIRSSYTNKRDIFS